MGSDEKEHDNTKITKMIQNMHPFIDDKMII